VSVIFLHLLHLCLVIWYEVKYLMLTHWISAHYNLAVVIDWISNRDMRTKLLHDCEDLPFVNFDNDRPSSDSFSKRSFNISKNKLWPDGNLKRCSLLFPYWVKVIDFQEISLLVMDWSKFDRVHKNCISLSKSNLFVVSHLDLCDNSTLKKIKDFYTAMF
jgi:hypothetical protein